MWSKIYFVSLLVQIVSSLPAPNREPIIRFQRDENGSGESCCMRRQKLEVLRNPDISGMGEVTVDVGECVQCDSPDLTSNANVSLPAVTECGSGKECMAKHTSLRTYHLFNGPTTKSIIKECQCQGVPSKCKRRKRLITYFEGSSFEQTIDIGECVGACSGFGLRKQCVAIENKTEVISGPNGKMCVSVTTSCQCVSTCYLVPMNEQYLEIFTDEQGQPQQRWKTINVGQCVGYCKPSNEGRICLFPQHDPCRIFLEPSKKNETCIPTHFSQETFISSHQQTKSVLKITACGCKQQ